MLLQVCGVGALQVWEGEGRMKCRCGRGEGVLLLCVEGIGMKVSVFVLPVG